jgi:hypothetical protein
MRFPLYTLQGLRLYTVPEIAMSIRTITCPQLKVSAALEQLKLPLICNRLYKSKAETKYGLQRIGDYRYNATEVKVSRTG